MSNSSWLNTAFILDDNQGDIVMRAIEPLTGIGRGLPIGINLSPRLETALDAGAIILTS